VNEGWRVYTLKELSIKIGSGATPKGGNESYKSEGISLIRSLNVHDGEFRPKNLAFIDEVQAQKLSNVSVSEGDVLINITGASIARCCVVPSCHLPARVNQHVSIIRPKSDIVDSRFLSSLLTSKEHKDKLLGQGESGSTRQALTKAQLQGYIVAIPPLPEQKRIVAILDEAFAGISQAIANTERNLKNARELFESYLNDVFTRKGEGWVEKPLFELCCSGITYGVIKLGEEVPDGTPCLRTSNVRWLFIDTEVVKKIDPMLSENYRRTILQGGEVLVNVRGTLGGVAVVPPEMKGWNVSREIAVVPVDPTIIDPRFLSLYIGTKGSQDWLTGVQKGVAYTGINLGDLRELPIAFPTQKHQSLIISKIDRVRVEIVRLDTIYHQKLKALSELKQSILQKAFTGDLTKDIPIQ
jgi:type I restriction enzyme S subunit